MTSRRELALLLVAAFGIGYFAAKDLNAYQLRRLDPAARPAHVSAWRYGRR